MTAPSTQFSGKDSDGSMHPLRYDASADKWIKTQESLGSGNWTPEKDFTGQVFVTYGDSKGNYQTVPYGSAGGSQAAATTTTPTTPATTTPPPADPLSGQTGDAGLGYGQISPGSYMDPKKRNNETVNPNVFGHMPSQQNPNAFRAITAADLPTQPGADAFGPANAKQMINGSPKPENIPASPNTNGESSAFMATDWGNSQQHTDTHGVYNSLQSILQNGGYGSGIAQSLVQSLQQQQAAFFHSQQPPQTMWF